MEKVSYVCTQLKNIIIMKNLKYILVVVTLMLMVSCENEQDVKSDLQRLKIERADLNGVVGGQRAMIRQQQITSEELSKQIDELEIIKGKLKQGKEPMYVLKLKMKQSRMSLDIGKHIKDGMNAIKFDLPVSKEFYNNVKVGTSLIDDFRAGSFIMNGSFSNWKVTVISKEIR